MKRSNLMFLAAIMFFVAGAIFTFLAWFNYVEGETSLQKQIISRIVIWSIPVLVCVILGIVFKILEKKNGNDIED
ncbi:MAG: hypothetical protein IJP63_03075 [Acholeplasmatales bacterium]|nr:hypothetical protein [Acholeplasmatales bacterium]